MTNRSRTGFLLFLCLIILLRAAESSLSKCDQGLSPITSKVYAITPECNCSIGNIKSQFLPQTTFPSSD